MSQPPTFTEPGAAPYPPQQPPQQQQQQAPPYAQFVPTGKQDYLPPSYSEAIEAPPTITQQFQMPAKESFAVLPGQVVMMVPRSQNGVWMWIPAAFTDFEQAKREAVMRLMYTAGFFIDEGIQWLEIHKGCTPRENRYLIYDSATGVPLFLAEEESEACDRCCMAPGYAKKMNIFIVDCFTVPNREVGPIWSMTREGMTCCFTDNKCTKCPGCGIFGMFNCCECSRDEFKMYQGYANAGPHELQSVPQIGRMKQQGCCSEGWCGNPTLSLFKGEEEDSYAVVEAPKFFGGWLSCLTDTSVLVSSTDSIQAEDKKGCMGYPLHNGDIARMRKLSPDDCASCCKEMCTDADRYTLDFTCPTLSVEQRVSVLGSLIAMDTMLWENDMKPIEGSDNGITCTFCNCYCAGCILPCCIHIPRNSG